VPNISKEASPYSAVSKIDGSFSRRKYPGTAAPEAFLNRENPQTGGFADFKRT
jgi:hypothetical protein